MLCAHKSRSANSHQQTKNLKQRALSIADRQRCKAALGTLLQGRPKAAAGTPKGCCRDAARRLEVRCKAAGGTLQGGWRDAARRLEVRCKAAGGTLQGGWRYAARRLEVRPKAVGGTPKGCWRDAQRLLQERCKLQDVRLQAARRRPVEDVIEISCNERL